MKFIKNTNFYNSIENLSYKWKFSLIFKFNYYVCNCFYEVNNNLKHGINIFLCRLRSSAPSTFIFAYLALPIWNFLPFQILNFAPIFLITLWVKLQVIYCFFPTLAVVSAAVCICYLGPIYLQFPLIIPTLIPT